MGMNIQAGVRAHQPKRAAWTLDHVQSQQVIYLSNCLDASTKVMYQSGFNSYLAFCNLHNFDLKPSPEMLSFFISFMACQSGVSGQTGRWGSGMRYTTLSPREGYRGNNEAQQSATSSLQLCAQ